MSRLRKYSRSLKEVFEDTLTVRYVASSLASFDAERTASKIAKWLREKDYDQVGVRQDGVVVGWARRDDLESGRLADHCRLFTDEDIVPGDLPLIDALTRVQHHRVVYVNLLGEVNGIVTNADIGRPPVRLWLFGLMTIAEMQLTRLLKASYKRDGWMSHFSKQQLGKVEKYFNQKKQKQTAIDRIDCLSLSEKRLILEKTPQLRSSLDSQNGISSLELLSRVIPLRNSLAHAQDILDEWPQFLSTAEALESFIERAETLTSRELRATG